MRPALALGAGALLLLAAVGLASWSWSWRAAGGSAGNDRLQARADGLERAVAALERRVTALEQSRRAGPRFPGAPAPELAAGVEQLQQRLTPLETEAAERRAAREEQDRRKATDLVWARGAILDRQSAPESRLRALKMLRSANERTREVAAAALEVIARPDVHPDTRSDLISELKGLTFPEIKAPVLAALGDGSHDDTRKEAVQVLQGFFDDPAVVAAVTRARDADPSATVRREAAERLDQWRTGRPPGK